MCSERPDFNNKSVWHFSDETWRKSDGVRIARREKNALSLNCVSLAHVFMFSFRRLKFVVWENATFFDVALK
jgi:hypothetical protein